MTLRNERLCRRSRQPAIRSPGSTTPGLNITARIRFSVVTWFSRNSMCTDQMASRGRIGRSESRGVHGRNRHAVKCQKKMEVMDPKSYGWLSASPTKRVVSAAMPMATIIHDTVLSRSSRVSSRRPRTKKTPTISIDAAARTAPVTPAVTRPG